MTPANPLETLSDDTATDNGPSVVIVGGVMGDITVTGRVRLAIRDTEAPSLDA